MTQQNMKTPLVFKIGVALLFAAILSFYFMGDLYARYTIRTNGTDSGSVASFSFTDNLEAQTAQFVVSASELYPGKTVDLTTAVTNNGEVAIQYVIKIVNVTHNLPIAIEDITLDSQVIAPQSTDTVVISLEWPKDENSISYAEKSDVIRITVEVVQAD